MRRDSQGKFLSNFEGPIQEVSWWFTQKGLRTYTVQVVTPHAKPVTLETQSSCQAVNWVCMFNLAKTENYYFRDIGDGMFVFKKPNSKKVISANVQSLLLDEPD